MINILMFCICQSIIYLITHVGCIAAGVGIAFSLVCSFVCVFVCALNGKQLELSTPNFVHVYSVAVARNALTQRSKGQGHAITKTVTVARLPVTHSATVVCCCCCWCGSACQYDCLCFLVTTNLNLLLLLLLLFFFFLPSVDMFPREFKN